MDTVAHAIADPVRRTILEALASRSLSAGQIAGLFTISRPAVSRHLRVLRESGLVVDRVEGRRRVYALEPAPLRPLVSWCMEVDRAIDWNQKLGALETEVHRARRARGRSLGDQQEETA